MFQIRIGPDLVFLAGYRIPARLSGMPCRISGFFLPDNLALPDIRPDPISYMDGIHEDKKKNDECMRKKKCVSEWI